MPVTAQSDQHEKNAHYRDMLRAYVDAIAREDLNAICALYAADAEVEDPLGGPRGVLKTPEDVRAFYQTVVDRHVRLTITGPVCGSKGNGAAMPVRVQSQGAELNCISVAQFNDAGLIKRYTAHWGPGDYDDSVGDPSSRRAG